MNQDLDLHLRIPISSLTDEFLCPICYDVPERCMMTPCGHNFCERCIQECLNVKAQCPVCNGKAVPEKLVPNKFFDRLVDVISVEKEKASKDYFQSLIDGVAPPSGASGPARSTGPVSPIEEAFRKHLRSTLATYEQYFQDMKAHVSGPDLEGSTALLVSALEEHLSVACAPPSLLPVSVTVVVESRNLSAPAVLQAHHPSSCLWEKARAILVNAGDPVVEFSTECYFVALPSGRRLDISDNVPVTSLGLRNGDSVLLRGPIMCESNKPKSCFKNVFVKGAQIAVNYYACKTCKLNWVCQACSDVCHEGHDVMPYLTDHVPTWACCYCSKRRCDLYVRPPDR